MTILQFISSEGYYGAESMLVSLARGYAEKGIRSIVGVLRHEEAPHIEVAEEARRRGLETVILPCRGRWDASTVSHLRRAVENFQVDVLQPHGYKADVYAYAAARRSRAALFSTLHNWTSKKVSMRLYFALDLMLLRRFEGVATPSERVGETLRKAGIAAEKVFVIPNGVDVAKFRSAKPVLREEIPGKRLIGFVGRMVAEKGGVTFLNAARAVLADYPDTTFVMVGEGPERLAWQSLAQQLGIARNVAFTGVRADMPEIYASLDMVVLPSLREAMPMSVLEALAAAKPVIATPVGSVPKVILAGRTGLLVPPEDAGALARAISGLLESPQIASDLGAQGRAHVIREFSSEAMAAAYLQQFERVLEARRGRARSRMTHQESEA